MKDVIKSNKDERDERGETISVHQVDCPPETSLVTNVSVAMMTCVTTSTATEDEKMS